VDKETGKVTLVQGVSADDLVSRSTCDARRQVNGGSAHMTGHCLLEDALYDEKGACSTTLEGLQATHAMDTPEYIVEHVHTHDRTARSVRRRREASSCSSLAP